MLNGKVLVLERTAQGSRSVPITWAAIAAILARLTQAIYMVDPKNHRARLQLYVDDPLLVVKGSEAQRKRAVVKFMLVLMVLGFPVAVAKAKYNQRLTWIGIDIEIFWDKVEVTVPAEKVADILALVRELRTSNVVAV